MGFFVREKNYGTIHLVICRGFQQEGRTPQGMPLSYGIARMSWLLCPRIDQSSGQSITSQRSTCPQPSPVFLPIAVQNWSSCMSFGTSATRYQSTYSAWRQYIVIWQALNLPRWLSIRLVFSDRQSECRIQSPCFTLNELFSIVCCGHCAKEAWQNHVSSRRPPFFIGSSGTAASRTVDSPGLLTVTSCPRCCRTW